MKIDSKFGFAPLLLDEKFISISSISSSLSDTGSSLMNVKKVFELVLSSTFVTCKG